MERIRTFWESKKCTWLMMAMAVGVILLYFVRKIPYINCVWELVDEYGYLANAAFLTNTDWYFAGNMYYGYGYSFLLVPLFWIYETGAEIIRGAIFVNIMCLVLLFFVQYVLISKLFKDLNRNLIVLISGALCFYPYLVTSTLKVIPECLLTLMIWVCGLLVYYVLDTGKWYYYVLLALSAVYTYFVHTRSFVFCAFIFAVVILSILLKKRNWKSILSFLLICAVFLVLGVLLKNNIIDMVYRSQMPEGDTSAVGNVLSINYMIDKIIGVFTNFSMTHVYSFLCKNLYLFAATAGMFHIGVYAAVKETFAELRTKKRIGAENAVKLMFALAGVMMAVALIVHAPGDVEKPAYFFYGRYYEYLIGPVTVFGVAYCIQHPLRIHHGIVTVLGVLVSGLGALDLSQHLATQNIYHDSNRVPAFSTFLKQYDWYETVIWSVIVFTVIVVLLNWGFSYAKKLYWLIPVVLFIIFFQNDTIIVDGILGINASNKDEYEVANYIHENYDVEEVYFLNTDMEDIVIYTGIQCILGKEKLNVIGLEGLEQAESGDLIITIYQNPHIEEWETSHTKLMEIGSYELLVVD